MRAPLSLRITFLRSKNLTLWYRRCSLAMRAALALAASWSTMGVVRAAQPAATATATHTLFHLLEQPRLVLDELLGEVLVCRCERCGCHAHEEKAAVSQHHRTQRPQQRTNTGASNPMPLRMWHTCRRTGLESRRLMLRMRLRSDAVCCRLTASLSSYPCLCCHCFVRCSQLVCGIVCT